MASNWRLFYHLVRFVDVEYGPPELNLLLLLDDGPQRPESGRHLVRVQALDQRVANLM